MASIGNGGNGVFWFLCDLCLLLLNSLNTAQQFSFGWNQERAEDAESLCFLSKEMAAKDRQDRQANWRIRVRAMQQLDCHLVAARIPKPIVLTGWSERLHLTTEANETTQDRKSKGARPTLLAVPAGAIYYFEGPDAPELADALSWHGNPARRGGSSVIQRPC
jgi:hypothetical protein